jgi:GNAT superfamily N-acetyltransferase
MPVTYHSPLHATLDLARRVDRAEIEFCAVAAGRGVATLDSGGGRALYGIAGSPLNKVLGLGLDGPVTNQDLDRIDAFYASRGAQPQIELCPFAYSDVAPRLCARGYVVQGFESQLGRRIEGADVGAGFPPSATLRRDLAEARLGRAEAGSRPDVKVTPATPEQDGFWVRVTAEGFVASEPPAGGGPAWESVPLDRMVDMMRLFVHPAIRRYLAWIDGAPAGGAASWLHDGVLGIFGSSTLPRFRRRGVQTALTIAILEDAGNADIAIATTAPGSTSQRTFERLGFSLLYTRTILIKT